MELNWNWEEVLSYELFKIKKYSIDVSNILGMVIIILVASLFLLVMKRIIERPNTIHSHSVARRRHSIYLLLKYFVWVIAFVLIMESLNLKVSILLAGSAALLVGIGFGLQPIFADLVSGFFMLFEGTVNVGDVIEADGVVGRIHEIKLRSTEVITRDNMVIIIPNSKFVVEKVINWSHNAESVRFTVEVGVAYGSDVEHVMSILREVMEQNDVIEKNPEPYVRFANFGESSLDFQLIFWTMDPFRVEVLKSNLRRAMYAKLNEQSIQIPFPQRDLHIKSGWNTKIDSPEDTLNAPSADNNTNEQIKQSNE